MLRLAIAGSTRFVRSIRKIGRFGKIGLGLTAATGLATSVYGVPKDVRAFAKYGFDRKQMFNDELDKQIKDLDKNLDKSTIDSTYDLFDHAEQAAKFSGPEDHRETIRNRMENMYLNQ
jgi:hypothetical protein